MIKRIMRWLVPFLLLLGHLLIAGRVNHQLEGMWDWLGIALGDIVSIGITVVFIAIQWRWSRRRSGRLQEIIYTVLHSMTLAASSTSIVALFARVITWTY